MTNYNIVFSNIMLLRCAPITMELTHVKLSSETVCIIERSGREKNTPASYLGGPIFKSRPGDRLS
jgi:hypothetical protein